MEKTANQKIYGRGFYDGLKAARNISNNQLAEISIGIAPMITSQKFSQSMDAITPMARKVYQCVPISEPWTTTQIYQEIRRTGSGVDQRIAGGCLNTLLGANLIIERPRGHFMRMGIKPPPCKTATELLEHQNTIEVEAKVIKEKKHAPLEALGQLSERIADLSLMLKKISDEIETVILEVQEHIESNDSQNQKLKQLQQLLKSLN